MTCNLINLKSLECQQAQAKISRHRNQDLEPTNRNNRITKAHGGPCLIRRRVSSHLNMVIASRPDTTQTEHLPRSNIFLAQLPANWAPYAELARIDKPVACLYFYFPCLFGTLTAASMNTATIPPIRLLKANLIFLLGSFLVRCVGCCWNDIVDQEYDRKVSRTCLRPMARKAISTSSALVFTILQVLVGLCLVFILLPTRCLFYSIPSIFLTGLYPYGKRLTYYPQLILGCVFSWGVIMAFPTFEIDLFESAKSMTAAGLLYFVHRLDSIL